MAKMKPILFSGQMVNAILDNRKTVTRRIAKFNEWAIANEREYNTVSLVDKLNGKSGLWVGFDRGIDDPVYFKSPYQPGDILWVRETWMPETEEGIPTGGFIYRATNNPEPDCDRPIKWRPSIFMPLRACRLFLRVVDVRPERLQEITQSDIVKEGIESGDIKELAALWDKINGKRSPFDSNPWVWRNEFEKLDGRPE